MWWKNKNKSSGKNFEDFGTNVNINEKANFCIDIYSN